METKEFAHKGRTLICTGTPTPDGSFVPGLVIRTEFSREVQEAMPALGNMRFNSAADAIEFARMAGANLVDGHA